MLWDSHIHTSFSHDGKSCSEVMIAKAKEIGLPGVRFTVHLDLNAAGTPDSYPLDLKGYLDFDMI